MRYLAIILTAAAILIGQAALGPAPALAGRDDGLYNRIILADHRDRRDHRDRDDWGRRDHRDRRDRRDHWDRRDRRHDDYYWNHRYYHRPYHRPHYRPHYRDRSDWDVFFWGPPLPIPLPLPIPVPLLPPPPHRW